MLADCVAHPDLFIKSVDQTICFIIVSEKNFGFYFKKTRIADLKSPEERMFAVLDWYLTSFHQINKVCLNFFNSIKFLN